MGKLAYGVPSRHVNASLGADTNLMKFYSTTNSTTYGRSFSSFEPRQGRHTGTGYLSNFRPGVYYTPHLDTQDNPQMGALVADNYHSVTQKSFRPSTGPCGREALPDQTTQVGSGFVRQKPLTIPTLKEARDVCIDTRASSAPADIKPRALPHLHAIQPKDPVELENGGYGPGFLTTEATMRFRGEQPDRSELSGKTVGYKDGSGFTHAFNPGPITFHPDQAHDGSVPGFLTNRPTGVSIQNTDFRPAAVSSGGEPLPAVSGRSARATGFTTGTKARPVYVQRVMDEAYERAQDLPPAELARVRRSDPAEYINTQQPNNHSSIASNIFRGAQQPEASEAGRMGRTSIGSKELSGYCENNDRFVATADQPARFITHYQTKYLDRNPRGMDREGHTWGAVHQQQRDGFTKSTQVHAFGTGEAHDGSARLAALHPYVASSIRSRDPCFEDHTYDAKRLSLKPQAAVAS